MDSEKMIFEFVDESLPTHQRINSMSKDQLFKASKDDEFEALPNRSTDSTRNSIGNLQVRKKGLKDLSPLMKQRSMVSEGKLSFRKLDNMIDYISAQLKKECSCNSLDAEEMVDDKYFLDQVVKIQSYFRMLPLRHAYRQQKQWNEYRRHVIQELYDTERQYVEDLKLIIEQVMNPLKTLCILNEDQIKKLFINIEQICWLNEVFLSELETNYFGTLKAGQKKKGLGEISYKFSHFFKMYYDYFQNFSVDIVEQMRKEPQLKQLDEFLLLREPPAGNLFRGLNLQAFLVKPVQRLPKYVLLFKDLLRHTLPTHPDHKNIEDALAKFKDVNQYINNQIDKYCQNSKMFEIQKLFGDPNGISILSATREFITDEALTVIDKHKERSVIVYFMNDLVLISEREQRSEKLYKLVYLNEKSFCKNLPNYKHFSNIFTLIGKHKSVTFMCESKENKSKIMEQLQTMINSLKVRKQAKNINLNSEKESRKYCPIKVHTIGTEEQESLITKFTVYIVEVSIGAAKLKIFTRYREMVKLEDMVRGKFPKLELPHLSTINWFNNKKTKVIEARKLQIENFLQMLLQSKQVMQNPEKWLMFLDLPPYFYELGTIEEEEISPVELEKPEMQRNPSQNIKLNQAQLSGFKSLQQTPKTERITQESSQGGASTQYSVVSASDLFRCSRGGPITKISRGSYQPSSDWKFKMPVSIEKITIRMMDGKSINLEITEQSRCGDIIEMIAHEIQLRAYLDFKLVICDESRRTVRVLDDDELLMKVLQGYNQSNKG